MSGYVLTGAAFPHGAHRLGAAPLRAVASGGAGVGPWEWAERLAPGIGLVVAVATCAALAAVNRRSVRAAESPAAEGLAAESRAALGARRVPFRGGALGWLVALVGVLGVFGLVPVRFNAASAAAYEFAQIGLAVAAGVSLGAVAQTAWRRRWAMQALVGGAVAACFMSYPAAATWALDAVSGGTSANLGSGSTSAAWWWPPAVAAVLAAGALVLDSGADATDAARKGGPQKCAGKRSHEGFTVPPAGRAAALVVLVGGGYGLFALAGGADAASQSGQWARMGASLALTIVLVAVCGAVLGAGGMILPASLAVTIVAEPLVAEASETVLLGAPVIVAVVVLAVAAAMVGFRWPSPGLGFVLLFVVALLGVLTFGDPQTLLVFRLLVGAVGGAYLLCSSLALRAGQPAAARQGAASAAGARVRGGDGLDAWHAVLVMAAVFVASAPAALAYRAAGVSGGVGGGSGLVADGGAPIGVGVAMTLSVVGCAAAYTSAVLAERVRRSR